MILKRSLSFLNRRILKRTTLGFFQSKPRDTIFSMERYKCFFIEETGERWIREYETGSSSGPYWKRTDTGEVKEDQTDFPVGAMWWAPWYDALYEPTLEHVLCVLTPGGVWIIDSQASNCTKPTLTYREGKSTIQPKMQTDHHCWCIHGTPPLITVNKNCNTCATGGGSIQCGGWHGFLTDGCLHT